MKVAIITEGIKGTGYGHLTRCLSVYQGFEEKGIIPVYIANCDETGEVYLQDVNLIRLNWLKENKKLVKMIKDFDIAVIDSYLASLKLYQIISNTVRKTVYFDDYLRLNYPPGIIVNGAIGAENLPYKKNDKQKYLLGIEYAQLRKPFWDVVISDKKNKKIKRIFLNFGGQDNKNLTSIILEKLLQEFPQIKYYVVYGKRSSETNRDGRIKYFYRITANKMLKLMLGCDFAITAAGQTLYELARTGVPTIAVGTADNQKYNLKGWLKRGFIKEELWADQPDLLDKIKHLVIESNNSVALERKVYCDGQGSRRLLNSLLIEDDENKYFLRKFNKEDIKLIFNLSNDDVVRKYSINTEKISWESHKKWYYQKLNSNTAYYLIALTFDQELIGQIRFDLINELTKISISISKNFRGKGLAGKILQSSCKLFFYTHPAENEIIAYIDENNVKSIRIFEKVGFIFKGFKLIKGRKFNYYILNKSSLNAD